MPEFNAETWDEFANPDYRAAYVESQLDATVAMQIKANREVRQWTQSQLADRAGMKQSRISTMEDVDYSSWSISTLKRLARVFECGLEVRFVPISSVIEWAGTMSVEKLRVPAFADDLEHAKHAARTREVTKEAVRILEREFPRPPRANPVLDIIGQIDWKLTTPVEWKLTGPGRLLQMPAAAPTPPKVPNSPCGQQVQFSMGVPA